MISSWAATSSTRPFGKARPFVLPPRPHYGLDVVYDGLASLPGVTYYKPEGAFYIVIGLPIKDSEHFAKWLVEEFEDKKETVLLAPAQGFYATAGKGTNEVRLAFMLNSQDLSRSVEILKKSSR